jgi:hypothetical protein
MVRWFAIAPNGADAPHAEHPVLMLIAAAALLIWLAQALVAGWFLQTIVCWLWPAAARRLPADFVIWLALAAAAFMALRP